MWKNAWIVALSLIGLCVGAGFATGQELLQFFVSFGFKGLWGVGLAMLVMIISSIAIMQLGSYLQAREHTAVFNRIATPWLARFLDGMTMFTLFCMGFIMIAGAGSNLNQQFGWPTWVGSLALVALLAVMGMLDIDKVSRVIGGITPIIFVLIVVAAVYTFATADWDLQALEPHATSVDNPLGAPTWWLAAINYVGLNLMAGAAMVVVITGTNLDTRSAGLGGVLAGIIFTILLAVATLTLFLNVAEVKDDDVPMLSVLTNIHPTMGLFMAIVSFLMILNTAVGDFYALGKRLTRRHTERFRITYLISLVIAFGFSFFPFDRLVNVMFPILGYLGLIMLLTFIVGWLRGRPVITTEASRRRRIYQFVTKRLDPREQYTRRDRAELQRATRKSNIANRKLIVSMVHEVEEALSNDSDLDYEPIFDDIDDFSDYIDKRGRETASSEEQFRAPEETDAGQSQGSAKE
ncbi:YkvI family membrane protein [Corynebacterium otitidis]|uniref:Membrane protein YkvI n=1 Tax=Corynebacterium otitidis ATCC 51513 TaxID=883169 RepID=I7L9G4_9CORY|nr:hypothetical protein [Corynebacterium otitidis]EJZ81772.1 hypothetical protein HMPREF9719_01289 [Corynebacterium otitidis ATCC 51513]CCI83777.1 hypothetical protein BN46_1051 [Corynebacterium otitidis ATCC 51513]